MEDDQLNEIRVQHSNIQNELSRLNKSIDDIAAHLEQDRKISQSRWVSNMGYVVIGLGIATLGIAATLQNSASTIISGLIMLIFGMALQSVSALLYPKRKRKDKKNPYPYNQKSIDKNQRNVVIGIVAFIAILLAMRKLRFKK